MRSTTSPASAKHTLTCAAASSQSCARSAPCGRALSCAQFARVQLLSDSAPMVSRNTAAAAQSPVDHRAAAKTPAPIDMRGCGLLGRGHSRRTLFRIATEARCPAAAQRKDLVSLPATFLIGISSFDVHVLIIYDFDDTILSDARCYNQRPKKGVITLGLARAAGVHDRRSPALAAARASS